MIKKFVIFLLIVLVIGKLIYNFNTYFYNPYLFEEDQITYLPYTAYKKTMGYTVTDYCKQDNSEFLMNKKEIKFIYNELKKGEILGDSVNDSYFLTSPVGCITIYSDIDNNKGMAIVSEIIWYGEEYDYVKVSGEFEVKGEKMSGYLYIKMTPDIKEFFSSKFNQNNK